MVLPLTRAIGRAAEHQPELPVEPLVAGHARRTLKEGRRARVLTGLERHAAQPDERRDVGGVLGIRGPRRLAALAVDLARCRVRG